MHTYIHTSREREYIDTSAYDHFQVVHVSDTEQKGLTDADVRLKDPTQAGSRDQKVH